MNSLSKKPALTENKKIINKPPQKEPTSGTSLRSTATSKSTASTKSTTTATTATKSTIVSKKFNTPLEVKGPFKRDVLNKPKPKPPNAIFEFIKPYALEEIFCYAASDINTLINISMACKKFRQILMERARPWIILARYKYPKLLAKDPSVSEILQSLKAEISKVVSFVKKAEISRQVDVLGYFNKNYYKLFEYNHVKENIANKLVQRLDLKIDVEINPSSRLYQKIVKNHPFRIKLDNNLTHFVVPLTEVANSRLDDLQVIEYKFIFHSAFLKNRVTFHHKFNKKDVFQDSIKTKAFCYYPHGSILLVYFDEDNRILYALFEISAIDVLIKCRESLSKKLNQPLVNPKLASFDTNYESFAEYLKYQLDFEVHIDFQNHKRKLTTYLDTRLYPKNFDAKKAEFYIDMQQNYSMKGADFYLDDAQGMSEKVEDFYLMDLILKDKDHVLVAFSGFLHGEQLDKTQIAKRIKNFMSLEMDVYSLKFKDTHYEFEILLGKDLERQQVQLMSCFVSVYSSVMETFVD